MYSSWTATTGGIICFVLFCSLTINIQLLILTHSLLICQSVNQTKLAFGLTPSEQVLILRRPLGLNLTVSGQTSFKTRFSIMIF